MPLSHSLEDRIAYERSSKIWPPPALDLDFGKIAGKTRGLFSRTDKRAGKGKGSTSSKASKSTKESESRISGPRRALTIGEQAFAKQDATSQTGQLQSPLFRLPVALRQKIYGEVLGNSNVHVTTIRGGQVLRHMRCKCATCPGFAWYVERGKWRREWECFGTKYTLDKNRIQWRLLQTCRQIYSEAIPILYSSNVFSFRDPKILQQFVAKILPQRRDSIRTMHLDLHFTLPPGITTGSDKHTIDFDRNLWKGAWDALASLPNLHNLEIRIHYTGPEHPNQRESLALVRQLENIQSLERCCFYLSDGMVVEDWMRRSPFGVAAMKDWNWEHSWTRKPLSVF